MDTFIIHPDIVKVIKKYVDEYPVEICANLKLYNEDSNNLVPHNVYKGKIEDDRGMCSHSEYSSHIFHSHNRKLYAYPSHQDILLVLKHYGKIKNSIIATKWGVWVISNTLKSNIYSSTSTSVPKIIRQLLDRIGVETSTTRQERERGADKSRILSDRDYILIDRVNKTFECLLNIKIVLYKWSDALIHGLILS